MKIKQIIAENKPTMTGVPPRPEPREYTTVRTLGTYGTKPGGTRTSTGGRVEKTDQGLRHTAGANNPNIEEEFNGSERSDNLVSSLNSWGYYTDDSKLYINDDNGDKIIRYGSDWKHLKSGKVGNGRDELDNFLSSKQGVAEDTKKDACYRKVKSRYKVWPSAYASGALVKCRQVGAANWGNKSKKK